MWEKIKEWFADMGEFLFKFTKTWAAQFIKKYGPVAMECVQAAALSGGTGKEKFAVATACMAAKVPEAAAYLIDTAIQVAYAMYKEQQENKDTDGDGVPDYRDMCKEVGKQLSGCVDENGCPCDPDTGKPL